MTRMRLAQPERVGPEEVFVLVGKDEVAAENICHYMNTTEMKQLRRQRFAQLAECGELHHLEFRDVWQEVVGVGAFRVRPWNRPGIPVKLVRFSDNPELNLSVNGRGEAMLVDRTTGDKTPCLRVVQDEAGVVYGVVEDNEWVNP